VTPACGLAGHGPTQVERVVELTHRLGERVAEQASAARFSVGA
jgi:hypothetical protein